MMKNIKKVLLTYLKALFDSEGREVEYIKDEVEYKIDFYPEEKIFIVYNSYDGCYTTLEKQYKTKQAALKFFERALHKFETTHYNVEIKEEDQITKPF
jgi:hypothetical protein